MLEITVITAAYLDSMDKVRWLRETADSILQQDFTDWEWIVVDDFSPTSPDLPSDVRIRQVRAASQSGPAMCRNVGIALARTDAVVVLDADDLIPVPGALRALYETWKEQPNHFVYGDLQILGTDGQPDRVVGLPEYDFLKSLEPKGIVPVTAVHSVECWHKAGGFKSNFVGLEDVEYWISCGKAGFCGKKIPQVTLLYRRHSQSRTAKMRAGLQEQAMRKQIREMHADVYGGNLPMGCCGGSRKSAPLPKEPGPPAARFLAQANAYPGGMIWVQYLGGRGAEFQVKGQTTGVLYKIDRHGAKFQVWAQDANFFAALGRGKDFAIGITPPEAAPEPTPVIASPVQVEYQPAAPALATIERLDPVGASTRGAPAAPPQEVKADPSAEPPSALSLDNIKILPDSARAMLTAEGWDVVKLANATVEELIPYPGIGKATAAKLIAEANRLWNAS